MGWTVKLTIVGGVLWLIAVVAEMAWYWWKDRDHVTQKEAGIAPADPPAHCDDSPVSQKVG